jgi:hypothetical protein
VQPDIRRHLMTYAILDLIFSFYWLFVIYIKGIDIASVSKREHLNRVSFLIMKAEFLLGSGAF